MQWKKKLQILGDLEDLGWGTTYHTIETGTLGHWLQPSLRSLLSPSMSFTKRVAREVMDEAALKVISASEIIFWASAD